MLFLQLKPGEYLTIGEDIAVQVFHGPGTRIRVAVKAPKEVSIKRTDIDSFRFSLRFPAAATGIPRRPNRNSLFLEIKSKQKELYARVLL